MSDLLDRAGKLIRVIDFETTGMPDDGAAVCEVGWCDVDYADGIASVAPSAFALLCNPGRPIPPHVQAVHHIGDRDLVDCPTPEVGFRRLMEGPPACFAAHNATFEKAFFGGGDVAWICTYKVGLRLYPEAESHSNQALRYLLGLDLPEDAAMPPHRAAPDAFVTAHILARFLNEGRATYDEMVRWSSGPALLPRITFGKHRGSKWEDAPSDYLRWIVDKSDLDVDAKANARHHLKLRASK